MAEPLILEIEPWALAVCRLAAGEAVPAWAEAGPFLALVRTPAELSIVCPAAQVPAGTACHAPWRALRVAGTLDFALTGVLASLAGPLAAAAVSIFAISSHDTDYVLVPAADLDGAVRSLEAAGHRVRREPA